jgi:hypothetical protein
MRAVPLTRALVALALVAVPAAFAPLACSPSSSGGSPADAAADAPAEAACPSDLPVACPQPAPGFDAAVLPIVTRRCWGCHGDGGIENAQHDLGSYDTIFRQRSAMLNQVYGCLLPPSDAAALTPDERAAILGWLVCGAPAN